MTRPRTARGSRAICRPARAVLDVCSYVGAWAVTALGHGAGSVTCVDSSETALGYVKRNAALNGMEVETLQGTHSTRSSSCTSRASATTWS